MRTRHGRAPCENSILRDRESRQSGVCEVVNAIDDGFRFAGHSSTVRIERLREQRTVADEEKMSAGVDRARVDRELHLSCGCTVERSNPQFVLDRFAARTHNLQIEKMLSVGKKLGPKRNSDRRSLACNRYLRLPTLCADSINANLGSRVLNVKDRVARPRRSALRLCVAQNSCRTSVHRHRLQLPIAKIGARFPVRLKAD